MKAFMVCLFVAVIGGIFALAYTAPRPKATCDAHGAIAVAVAKATPC